MDVAENWQRDKVLTRIYYVLNFDPKILTGFQLMVMKPWDATIMCT